MSLVVTSLIVCAVLLLCLDALWLTSMAGFYRSELGDLLVEPFRLAPAALFYVLYLVGILAFAVLPSLAQGGWTAAAGRGALLGLVAYGTYDLTNQATLKAWSWRVTAVDMAWGTVLTALTAAVAVLIVAKIHGAPN